MGSTNARMHRADHVDELDIDTALVRRLLRGQHPRWAALDLERVASSGTDNAIYRLGDELVVRLPRHPGAVPGLLTELRWLPVLGPRLPLAVPEPVAAGTPGEGYPWPWAVYAWMEGSHAGDSPALDLSAAAVDLAAFVRAVQAVPTGGGPPAPWGRRGTPLVSTEPQTRAAIAACEGLLLDLGAVTAAWESALRLPPWDRPPVWFHGDIAAGNLLVRDGRIAAVLDFGGCGVGDPACDLVVAWELLDADARAVFRDAVEVDDATWERGRGWALATALWALPYYLHTNGFMVAQAQRKIAAVLAS